MFHIGTKRKWFWEFGSRDTLGGLSSIYQLRWEESVRKGNTKCCCKWFSVRHTRNAKMFTAFFCKVLTSYWCMFQWRLVKTNESGIFFSSTKLIISWRKRIPVFFCAFWNVWSPCCSYPFYKIHPLKKKFCHKSRYFKYSRLLLLIKAFAMATATTLLTMPPFFQYM